MAEEEEVRMEVEAVAAVYGEECVVKDSFPPHLLLHIKPRTADVSSQQFVEAVIGIRAGVRYPEEPPKAYLLESKGLDEQRQNHLITSIQAKASELSSCSMLVALCEEAIEKLSMMNHPDGDCPLCLHPLVSGDRQEKSLPFMKLMSCFHCFHSGCIIRWWNWLQNKNEGNIGSSSSMTLQPHRDMENQNDNPHEAVGENTASCPVCRKAFHTKDFEHVLDLVNMPISQLSCDRDDDDVDDHDLPQSHSEIIRRQKFEAALKLQKEHGGLIEPKKELVVLPGMFLPQPVALPSHTLKEDGEQQPRDSRVLLETNSGGSSSTRRRNSGRRKQRVQNSRNQVRQWIIKENGTKSLTWP